MDILNQFAADSLISEDAHLKLDFKTMVDHIPSAAKSMAEGQEIRFYSRVNKEGHSVGYFVICASNCATMDDLESAIESGDAQIFNLTNNCPPFC